MLMRFLRRMQPLFVLLAVLFMAFLLRSQWEELQTYAWQINPLWLTISAACLMAAWAVEVAIWRRLLHSVGSTLPYFVAVRIWFLSAIVRYIPGNIWQPLTMTLMCQRRGVKPEATLTSVVLYQVLIILGVAPIAAVYFAATGNWGILTELMSSAGPWLIAIGVAPVTIFIVQPGWLIEIVNWGLHRLGRAPLPMGLSRAELVAVLTLTIVDWLIWGAAFCALAFGISQTSPAEMWALAPHLIAVYAVAYAIGFLSFLTPSGLGVREGAFYVLLAPVIGGGAVTVLALAMRVWTTLGEFIAAAISALFPDRIPAPMLTNSPADVGIESDLGKGLT